MNEDLSKIGSTFQVRVTPKAAANRIKVEQQDDGTWLVRVYVTTAPEDGKANKAVIELLARHLGIPKSSLVITRGMAGKNKLITIRQ